MTLNELTKIVQRASELGVSNYIKRTQPSADLLTQRECQRWLHTLGVPFEKLKVLIRDGVIPTIRKGQGKNSPILISKSDLLTYLLTKEIGPILYGRN